MKHFFRNIALFIIPILLVVIVLLSIPVDKQFAYHFIKGNCYNHGAWVYDRIFENDTPIDVAFIGSSRTLHCVNEKLIEKKLTESFDTSFNVVNLGYCQFGRNFQHIILKDLLSEKQPRLVIIEITEDEQQYTHPSFPYIASSVDVLSAPMHKAYFSDLYKNVASKFEYFKSEYVFNNNSYPINSGNYGYGSSTRVTNQAEVDMNSKFWDRRIKRNHKGFFGRVKDRYPFHYLSETIKLLEDNNIEYCFLFIPTTNQNIEKSVFDDYYRSKADVYSISPAKYSDMKFWMDASHFNDDGSSEVANELTELLRKQLCLIEN